MYCRVRSRRAGLFLVITMLAWLVACGPKLHGHKLDGVGSATQQLTESPAIVVGSVKTVERVGWSTSSIYGRQPTLFRSKVMVESVLQGGVIPSNITVYFFRVVANWDGDEPLIINAGDRYIFYLRKESGEWRTACDFREACVNRVLSGPHPGFRRNLGRPIGDDIVDILFSRGVGVSDQEMIKAYEGEDFLWAMERKSTFAAVVKAVAKTASPVLREKACELLNRITGQTCPKEP